MDAMNLQSWLALSHSYSAATLRADSHGAAVRSQVDSSVLKADARRVRAQACEERAQTPGAAICSCLAQEVATPMFNNT